MMINLIKTPFVLIFIYALLGVQDAIASNLIPKELSEEDKFVVVLDAGHGGNDPGNRGNGYFEKDIALNIVLKVGGLLEKDKRFKVIYTRKTDKFVELYERGAIANKASADLFVSVHCNAHNSQAYGTETFVLGLHANDRNFEVAKKENAVILLEDDYESNYEGFDPNSPESVIGLTLMQEEYLEQSLTLASMIQDKFTKSLKKKNRGVKQAGFVVLHKTFMPSVLIETGFLTHVKEGKYLNSKSGQQAIAASIFKAILNYKETNDKRFKEGITPVIPEKVTKPKIETAKTPPMDKKPMDSGKAAAPDEKVIKELSDPENTEVSDSAIVFKVQIAASSNELALEPKNFKGLKGVSRVKIGSLYKYYYGESTTLESVQENKQKAKASGFPSCFVVAFRGKKPIPLAEAVNAQ